MALSVLWIPRNVEKKQHKFENILRAEWKRASFYV